MSKIDKSESNLYSIPKRANVLKAGAVYINDENYGVEPTEIQLLLPLIVYLPSKLTGTSLLTIV